MEDRTVLEPIEPDDIINTIESTLLPGTQETLGSTTGTSAQLLWHSGTNHQYRLDEPDRDPWLSQPKRRALHSVIAFEGACTGSRKSRHPAVSECCDLLRE